MGANCEAVNIFSVSEIILENHNLEYRIGIVSVWKVWLSMFLNLFCAVYISGSFGSVYILKGAAAPPAAGPFNSTLHTGDPISGLNVVLLYLITYALRWWHMVSSCVVVNLFLAPRALCLAC